MKLGSVESVSVHVPPAVVPVVKRYWYSVIGDPPVSVGATHDKSAVVRVVVTDRLVGEAGTVVRVVSVTDALASPSPCGELTARTRKMYSVPLSSPVTVYEVVALPVEFHVPPSSLDTS